MALDLLVTLGNNSSVLVNPSTSFSRLNIKADSRLAAIFTSVRNAIGTPSLSGRGVGYLRVCRFLDAGLLTHAMRPAPSFSSDGSSLTLIKEAITMPSITRALSRLFPISSTISTAATMVEAQTIARMHLARTGHAVRIAPAARGFSVVEVR
jgi:hypothetical protein